MSEDLFVSTQLIDLAHDYKYRWYDLQKNTTTKHLQLQDHSNKTKHE